MGAYDAGWEIEVAVYMLVDEDDKSRQERVDEDWEENGCGISVMFMLDIDVGRANLLLWTDPLENLSTSGHLLKDEYIFYLST